VTPRGKDKEVIWYAQVLLDSIGARILSRLSGADGPLGSYTWPEPGDPGPDTEQTARVRTAYYVYRMLSSRHPDDFVSDWLMTLNVFVGQRPADAIAADEFASVLQAAQLVRESDMLGDPSDDEEEDDEFGDAP